MPSLQLIVYFKLITYTYNTKATNMEYSGTPNIHMNNSLKIIRPEIVVFTPLLILLNKSQTKLSL